MATLRLRTPGSYNPLQVMNGISRTRAEPRGMKPCFPDTPSSALNAILSKHIRNAGVKMPGDVLKRTVFSTEFSGKYNACQ